MTDNLLKSQAFKLKGRLYTLTVLHILDTNHANFELYLADVIAKAPRMFEKAPVVLDFTAVQESVDLEKFCLILRAQGLIPVAVQCTDMSLQASAIAHGIAIISGSSEHDKVFVDEVASRNEPPSETIKTKLLTTPVRSGQQIVSLGGDLVVVSSVGHGAELLAEGHIHVYGALRGRALAGIEGNKQARIFCHLLDAELVSIAGFYRLRDELDPPAGPCQIYLQDDHIHIEPL